MAVWLITCCPPYQSVDVVAGPSKAVRPDSRLGSTVMDDVNPTADFTDGMWCRDRTTIEALQVDSRAVRE